MRVVADSNALVFYLYEPGRLTDAALEALGEAEDTDGISVSVASIGDLWYVSQKRPGGGVLPGTYECAAQKVITALQAIVDQAAENRGPVQCAGCQVVNRGGLLVGVGW